MEKVNKPIEYIEEELNEYIQPEMRTEDEIVKYMNEAFDKVWLMRNCHIPTKTFKHEVAQPSVERIFATYNDIPDRCYTDWECGFWNGVLATLRWVLGEDSKMFLDT